MKTIAIIASCDTKGKEVAFMRECLDRAGFASLVIDTSIGPDAPDCADISREQVVAAAGVDWNDVRDKPKNELVELVTAAVRAVVAKLYAEKRFDGVIAAGGVQNSIMATGAMQALPIGFPTVVASVMASGSRTFGSLVGDKDIAVIPSICDFTGINPMTRTILANACAAVCGMAEHAGKPVAKGDKPVVGFTLLGVTTHGAVAASEELERHGVETIGFHASGTGGRVMEQMAESGVVDAVFDLTTHEICSEFFGGGYAFGDYKRLVKTPALGIPLVVSTGGLDFVDYPAGTFPPRMDERVFNMHNSQIAHIKILPDEAVGVGKLFASRLNLAEQGVRLLVPTEGMRKNTRPGGNLYAPETDKALMRAILDHVGDNVRVEHIEGNIDDAAWGIKAAHAVLDELTLRGVLR